MGEGPVVLVAGSTAYALYMCDTVCMVVGAGASLCEMEGALTS